jgi:hypothetical protein
MSLAGRGARCRRKGGLPRGKAQSISSALLVWRPTARIGAGMSQPRGDDPVAALNQALSDVIDTVLDVRQAHRRVPETHALHAVLDRLLDDMRTWAGLLMDQDQALGVSPLANISSGAGRMPPHSWHEPRAMRMSAVSSARISTGSDSTWPQHSRSNTMTRYGRLSPRWNAGWRSTGGRSARSEGCGAGCDDSWQPLLVEVPGDLEEMPV